MQKCTSRGFFPSSPTVFIAALRRWLWHCRCVWLCVCVCVCVCVSVCLCACVCACVCVCVCVHDECDYVYVGTNSRPYLVLSLVNSCQGVNGFFHLWAWCNESLLSCFRVWAHRLSNTATFLTPKTSMPSNHNLIITRTNLYSVRVSVRERPWTRWAKTGIPLGRYVFAGSLEDGAHPVSPRCSGLASLWDKTQSMRVSSD